MRVGPHLPRYRRVTARGVCPVQPFDPLNEQHWLYGVVKPAAGETRFWEMPALDAVFLSAYLAAPPRRIRARSTWSPSTTSRLSSRGWSGCRRTWRSCRSRRTARSPIRSSGCGSTCAGGSSSSTKPRGRRSGAPRARCRGRPAPRAGGPAVADGVRRRPRRREWTMSLAIWHHEPSPSFRPRRGARRAGARAADPAPNGPVQAAAPAGGACRRALAREDSRRDERLEQFVGGLVD